jgi:starch phosphorylase
MKITTEGERHVFEIQVYLDGLDPDAVRVEVYADGENDGAPERTEMARGGELVGAVNGYTYSASVPASRPAGDYTPRLIPNYGGVAVPLEAPYILWQR